MLSRDMTLNKTQEDLSQNMAKVLSKNKDLQYAQFKIKTMSLPDGRMATFSFRLEPVED